MVKSKILKGLNITFMVICVLTLAVGLGLVTFFASLINEQLGIVALFLCAISLVYIICPLILK